MFCSVNAKNFRNGDLDLTSLLEASASNLSVVRLPYLNFVDSNIYGITSGDNTS